MQPMAAVIDLHAGQRKTARIAANAGAALDHGDVETLVTRQAVGSAQSRRSGAEDHNRDAAWFHRVFIPSAALRGDRVSATGRLFRSRYTDLETRGGSGGNTRLGVEDPVRRTRV